MNHIRSWSIYIIRQAGVSGIVGIGILLAVLAFYLIAIKPMQANIASQQAQYDESMFQSRTEVRGQQSSISRQEKIAAFFSFFPQEKYALAWIGKIYQQAEKEKLQLRHGEYQYLSDKGKRPFQTHVLLPVHGSYGQIRSFIVTSLAEIPFLALDQVTFERDSEGNLEAQIHFTLFLET